MVSWGDEHCYSQKMGVAEVKRVTPDSETCQLLALGSLLTTHPVLCSLTCKMWTIKEFISEVVGRTIMSVPAQMVLKPVASENSASVWPDLLIFSKLPAESLRQTLHRPLTRTGG